MGSPVLVTVANLVKQDIEERDRCSPEILEAIHGWHLCSTANLKNARVLGPPQWSWTQHTVHGWGGVKGKLPFLDILLQQDPDWFILTTVLRNATHTDCYLDFMSHHSLAHKLAVVKTLHGRVRAISLDVTAKDKETRHIRQTLINNGFQSVCRLQPKNRELGDTPVAAWGVVRYYNRKEAYSWLNWYSVVAFDSHQQHLPNKWSQSFEVGILLRHCWPFPWMQRCLYTRADLTTRHVEQAFARFSIFSSNPCHIHNYLPMPSFGWLMGVPAKAHHSLHAVWQVPQPKLPTISCLLPQQLAHSL